MTDEEKIDETTSESDEQVASETPGDEESVADETMEVDSAATEGDGGQLESTDAPEGELEEAPEANGVARFDFRRPLGLPSDSARPWEKWMTKFCKFASEKSAVQFDGAATDWKDESEETMTFESARENLNADSIAVRVTVGSPSLESMMVLDQRFAKQIALAMLGEKEMEADEPVSLSQNELALVEWYFSGLVQLLGESWPQKETIACTSLGMQWNPARSRFLGPQSQVLVSWFRVTNEIFDEQLQWIIPSEPLEKLVGQIQVRSESVSRSAPGSMSQRALELPVSLSVLLGKAELSVREMANLSQGDIVILEQSVFEPLPVLVGGSPKFNAVLGRNKKKQALKIVNIS